MYAQAAIFDHNKILNGPEIVICNDPELSTLMILWVSAGRLIDNPQVIKKTQMSTVSMNELSAGILAPAIKFILIIWFRFTLLIWIINNTFCGKV